MGQPFPLFSMRVLLVLLVCCMLYVVVYAVWVYVMWKVAYFIPLYTIST